MTYLRRLTILAIIVALLPASTKIFAQRGLPTSMSVGLNRIEGRIVNESNISVYNAYVELYNDVGSLVSRQRSTSSGMFSFRGMGPGRYTISVKPFGTNLLEDSRDIEVNNQYARSDTVIVEFRLRVDKRFRDDEIGIVGTVFAQEVPADAKRFYKLGIDDLETKRDQAIAELEEAVKLFPTYFDALTALGKALVLSGHYEKGYPFLLKAIDVNSKCADCFYSLGLAFYKLNEIQAGIKAADAAEMLSPQSPAIRLLQGMLYRLNNDPPRAEKALLTAKSLFKEPSSEVHWQLSMVYNRMNRNQDAANELEEYLKTNPDATSEEKRNIRNLIAKLRNSK